MFYKCESLKNINLSNFNTTNVESMKEMFYGCKSLKNLNLSNFNFLNVNDMSNMFSGCESLINIEMPKLKNKNKIKSLEFFLGFIR